jgi:NAD-dependent SIR2 family protein deacetylase
VERTGRDWSIVVLTGAGISAESGLPTFRGSDGLWLGWRLGDVATPEAFARASRTWCSASMTCGASNS